jgi:hypothetical protein
MITIEKVTSNVQGFFISNFRRLNFISRRFGTLYLFHLHRQEGEKCSRSPPSVSRHLLTGRTVFWKTVFSVARSTFWMCFVMAIFKSSILCTVIVRCTEIFDHPVFGNGRSFLTWIMSGCDNVCSNILQNTIASIGYTVSSRTLCPVSVVFPVSCLVQLATTHDIQ